jgi:transcriptional regulator with XRE-family HTH domain
MEEEIQNIREKILLLRKESGFSQQQMVNEMQNMTDSLEINQSKYARFEKGKSKIDLEFLILFCKTLNLTLKEFFIYPDTINNSTEEQIKAVIQIELKKDKKDQVLKLIFGENNLEILNR